MMNYGKGTALLWQNSGERRLTDTMPGRSSVRIHLLFGGLEMGKRDDRSHTVVTTARI